jgi:S1-C subfamily serine protease
MTGRPTTPPALRSAALLAAALALAAAAGALAWQAGRALFAAPEPAPIVVSPAPRAADEEATIALFERAKDSVVFITTRTRVADFWRRSREVPAGTGSGFVWDGQGHIVTNAHVIAGATGATVRLADGSVHRAQLVGTAPQHDLAVLRIDARGLQPLARGTSGDLAVGQNAFAIGNPFGLDFTLTTGIVSALDRELEGRQGPPLRGLIQTDAAINPGNSGGPLLDSAGALIGVNTAIYSPSGSSAGIGFAVPADTVARVVPQLIATGRYAPPSLGIEVDARVNAMARRQGLSGVLVLGVTPGSAAARAGLRPARLTEAGRLVPGDILVELDGREIATVDDLSAALAGLAAGATVPLVVEREGRRMRMELTLDAGRDG